MPLLATPRQLSQRAELYQQLSQLTAAGIGLPQAIECQRRSPPAHSFRAPLSLVSERLAEGSTFYEALVSTGRWLPAFDGALLNAGARSGRLPECFRLLAGHYENSAALVRKMISSLIYPALLFHMAIFISPLPGLVSSGNFAAYCTSTIGILVPLYAVVGFVLYAMQSQHGERWRSLIELV